MGQAERKAFYPVARSIATHEDESLFTWSRGSGVE